MNMVASIKAAIVIDRVYGTLPILILNQTEEGAQLAIRAGTTITIDGQPHAFDTDTPVTLPDLIGGENYGVRLGEDGAPFASLLGPENAIEAGWIGGFHHAPGGNADAREGGNNTPAINPHSFWDIGFRPACPDPRGMVFVDMSDDRIVWLDIYLLASDHKRHGTSCCGVRIADGNSLARLNYHDAVAIMAEHGKRLPTYDEFRAAAYGVKERSSADRHPKTTGLDAARTSACGLMQATGNLWVWGTDGDADNPAPSFLGGSWLGGSNAGSRCADLGYWPESSDEDISARGACDHLAA